jgi:hypothetical protein
MRKSKEAPQEALKQDRVVAGSALDFMEVRHIVLEGTNALAEGIAGERGGLSVDFIKRNHKTADATLSAASLGLQTPIRTLWHALYFPERRRLQVSFYLGEGSKGKQVKRSDYLEFLLTKADSTVAG